MLSCSKHPSFRSFRCFDCRVLVLMTVSRSVLRQYQRPTCQLNFFATTIVLAKEKQLNECWSWLTTSRDFFRNLQMQSHISGMPSFYQGYEYRWKNRFEWIERSWIFSNCLVNFSKLLNNEILKNKKTRNVIKIYSQISAKKFPLKT